MCQHSVGDDGLLLLQGSSLKRPARSLLIMIEMMHLILSLFCEKKAFDTNIRGFNPTWLYFKG